MYSTRGSRPDDRSFQSNSDLSKHIETAKAVISVVATVAGGAVLFRQIANDLLPEELHRRLTTFAGSILGKFSPELTLDIDELDGLESNLIYDSATLYLGTKTKAKTNTTHRRFKISQPRSNPAITVAVCRDEPVSDHYNGVWYTWTLVYRRIEPRNRCRNPNFLPDDSNLTLSLELRFNKKHKEEALNRYIPYVIKEAKKMKDAQKSVKLYTVRDGYQWSGLNLNHPATFDTIAMDPREKERIIEDLDLFVRRKEYYQSVGKAWKRGYLLYGPPGTGKSSLIAAIANYLRFNVYDLEIGALNSNSNLRTLLLATENRSILVVEDIDCSVQLKNRVEDKTVTLSGFLNSTDGLWSSCGDGRIIIFTTNYKEKLDPALLRAGRMDMHIHMSYCTPSAFSILARNYIGVETHGLFKETAKLIEQVKVTPAEVAEQLMKADDPQVVLQGLVGFLRKKKAGIDDDQEEPDKSLVVR